MALFILIYLISATFSLHFFSILARFSLIIRFRSIFFHILLHKMALLIHIKGIRANLLQILTDNYARIITFQDFRAILPKTQPNY